LNLIRIGKIIINFDNVTDVIQANPSGSEPETLSVQLINGKSFTFTGDEAHGLQAFLDRTVKTAVKPLDDFIVQ
jgi:hypothetical protein